MSEPTASRKFLAALPKAELHVHLEGSLEPETLRELASKDDALSKKTEEWIETQRRRKYRYSCFPNFIEAFKFVAVMLQSPADYALAATRLVERLAAQNVRYVEITLSAGVILWKKQPVDAIFEAARAAAAEAGARSGVRVNWIFDAIRQFGPDHALQVLDWASRYQADGVVAFGLGGDETRGPETLFGDVYGRVRDSGLHAVVHSGETNGPENVRQAVELLQAERIGHGLAAARDSEVMSLLRDRAIPLEVCPTSNVAVGLVPGLKAHPLPVFLSEGVKVTINSDDPGLFGTTLVDEYVNAAEQFSLGREHIFNLCRNAVDAAFLSQPEKERLLEEIGRAEFKNSDE